MKRVLITGGAGFIGSHLSSKLVEEDNHVICLDNFYTGSKSNISKLEGKKNFEVLVHDVTVLIKIKVDEIYNLACPASPIHYQKNPVQTTKTMKPLKIHCTNAHLFYETLLKFFQLC